MARYVALLRGINVGGKHKVPMKDLKATFESLGFADVATFIQSGNVVFTAAKAPGLAPIEKSLGEAFGFAIPVILRSGAELAKAIKQNPFPDADPNTVHVGFMAEAPAPAAVKGFDAEKFLPERFAVKGTDLYLHLPNGMGRAKLPPALDRALKVATTVRNWRTVTALAELASG